MVVSPTRAPVRRGRRAGWAILAVWGAVWGALPVHAQSGFDLGPLTLVAGSPGAMGGDVGRYAALTHDPDGGQHIAYYDALFGDLRYAFRRRLSDPWTVEVVEATGDVGRYASIAIGDPQIQQGRADVVSGSRFVTIAVGPGLHPRMAGGRFRADGIDPTWYRIAAVDPEQSRIELELPFGGATTSDTSYTLLFYQPVIAYQDATGPWALKVARPQVNGAWRIDTVHDADGTPGSPARTGFFTSVAVDANNRIHLAWQDRTTLVGDVGRLYYALFDGVAWTREIVDPTPQRGGYARLVLDGAGNPTIFYRDDGTPTLLSALRTGATWQIQALDTVGRTGAAISVDYFAPGGRIVAAWQDAPSTPLGAGTVRYGEGFDAGGVLSWRTVTVGADIGWGEYTAIAYGPTTGTQHLAFYDAFGKRLMMTRYQGSPTSFTVPIVLDRGGDVGRYCSADFHPQNDVFYVAHYDADRRALRLASYDGVSTASQIVDGVRAGEYSDVALTSSEVVVAYYHGTERTLHVARWPRGGAPGGPGFSDVVVDAASDDVGAYVSMAVDAADRIYLAYYDRARTNLRFAMYANGMWSTFKLAGEDDGSTDTMRVGEHCRLAINPAATQLGLVFYDADREIPIWGTAAVPDVGSTVTAVQFTAQPLLEGVRAGRFASLAFDTSDTLYVACFNDTTLHPLVVRTGAAGGIWELETEPLHVAGWYTSIAIDPLTRRPAVAYYDVTNSSLKYAAMGADGAWSVVELDADGDTGRYPRLFFDEPRGQAYLVYYDASQGRLRAITRLIQAGASWHEPLTLAEGGLGVQPALTADDAGRLYLVFHDPAGGDLYTFATGSVPAINAAGPLWFRYH